MKDQSTGAVESAVGDKLVMNQSRSVRGLVKLSDNCSQDAELIVEASTRVMVHVNLNDRDWKVRESNSSVRGE